MPLLSPKQIQNVLKETGIKDQKDVKKILEVEGLGVDELISELGSVVRGADSTAMKLKGIETGLKLHGLMKNDEVSQVPVVNIIINDSEFCEVNPILKPRE